ncbi:MAG TPA: MMPL family transporter [Thermoplasmata archaeon]|nr:MMPL family transporter [Thermoplasmata archaeon]
MDPKDYLPSNAESIQILDEITTEMMGVSLLTFSTDMSAPSDNMTNIMPISIYIKSDKDLTKLESIRGISDVEQLIRGKFEGKGLEGVQSYASFIDQILKFYGGEEGKIPPLTELMKFMEVHEISLSDFTELTSTFGQTELTFNFSTDKITKWVSKFPNISHLLFELLKFLNPELSTFLEAHNISFSDIQELLLTLTQGSQDSQAEMDFMFSLIPDPLMGTLLTADRKETLMTVSVQGAINPMEFGIGRGDTEQNKELRELEQGIQELLEDQAPDWLEFTVAGPMAMQEEMSGFMLKWLVVLIPTSLAAIAISLTVFHRNGKSVVIVLLPTLVGIMLNLGTLGLLPTKFAFEDVIIAPCLIAFGFAYSLHLTNRFSEEAETHDPKEAIRRTLPTSGRAVLLSAITTMVGFASLMITPLPMVAKMGFVFVLGIFYLLISAIVLVPCLLLMLRYRKRGRIKEWKRILQITAHPKLTILVAVLITLVSLSCITHISTEVDLFAVDPPADLPLTKKSMDYMEKLGMGQPGVLMVKGDFTNSSFLKDLEALEVKIGEIEDCRAYSMLDFMKPFNLGQIPTGAQIRSIMELAGETISGMMGGIGGTEEAFLDKSIVMVDMPRMDIKKTEEKILAINKIIDSHQLTNGSATHLTGMGAILADLHSLLLPSQIQSIAIAIIAVFACLVLVFRSFKYGVFTLIPLVLVILWEPLLLVGLNVPLSVITIAIASIVIGTGIDFGVHITERIREEVKNGKSGMAASQVAVMTTGQSLLEAIVAVILALLPIYLLGIEMMNQFITIVILMLVVACVSALLILPTIYITYYKKEPIGKSIADLREFYEDSQKYFKDFRGKFKPPPWLKIRK